MIPFHVRFLVKGPPLSFTDQAGLFYGIGRHQADAELLF